MNTILTAVDARKMADEAGLSDQQAKEVLSFLAGEITSAALGGNYSVDHIFNIGQVPHYTMERVIYSLKQHGYDVINLQVSRSLGLDTPVCIKISWGE